MGSHGNKIKVTLERKPDYNRIKGSKIISKNNLKTRTPLPVKPRGNGINHLGSHLASEEDGSREGASSGGPGQGTYTSLPSPVYSAVNAHGRLDRFPPEERLHGTLGTKRMKDANHGVFTMSMPAHVDVNVGGGASQ